MRFETFRLLALTLILSALYIGCESKQPSSEEPPVAGVVLGLKRNEGGEGMADAQAEERKAMATARVANAPAAASPADPEGVYRWRPPRDEAEGFAGAGYSDAPGGVLGGVLGGVNEAPSGARVPHQGVERLPVNRTKGIELPGPSGYDQAASADVDSGSQALKRAPMMRAREVVAQKKEEAVVGADVAGMMATRGGPAGAPPQQNRAQAMQITAAATPPPVADKNGWYQNTYQGGFGSRESLEKAVQEGVIVDGQRIKVASFTRSFKQSFPFPTSGALGVITRTERTKAPPEGGSVFLEVGFQAAAREAGERPPLNVALVIDRSGSMQTEHKMDAVRAAARAVVDQLGARDKLAIVSYASTVTVDAPIAPVKGRSAALKEIVDRIQATGGTNIYEGLEKGYAELTRVARQHDSNLVLLLTDGQVSAGIRDPKMFEALAKQSSDRNIATTTIGMGVSYNEDLMMTVSSAGGGGYHFLKDGGDVANVIHTEINDLSRSIARGVRLRVELAPDVDLVRVLGSDQLSEAQTKTVKAEERKIDQKVYEELGITKDRSDQDEAGIKMLIPAFGANDSHVVLMEVRVPPGKGTKEIAKVQVKYKDVMRKKNAEVQTRATVQYAPDKATSIASIQPSVKKNILGFQTGEALMSASRLVATNNIPTAVRKIDDQMVLVGVAAREWKDADLARDAELLGQYKDLLIAQQRRGLSPELAAYLGKSFSYSAYQRLK